MIFLQTFAHRPPICPTFVHDDPTRILICVVGIVLCSFILCEIMRYFSNP
jgi:hypothetical protein